MEIQSEKKIKIAIIIVVIALALEIIYISGILKSNKTKKQVESENILKTVEQIKENKNTDIQIDTNQKNLESQEKENVPPPDPRTKPVPPAPKRPTIKK